MKCFVPLLLIFNLSAPRAIQAASPPPLEAYRDEPVVYVGSEKADIHRYDGGFRAAVGVHRIQVYRASRSRPLPGDRLGWTYNHAPMLAYWQGRFWLN